MDPREVCALHRKNRYGLILFDGFYPVSADTSK